MQMRKQLPNGRALNRTILQKTANLLLPLFSAQTTCADSCDGHKMRPTIKQGRRTPCRQLFSPQWRHSLSCSQNYISNIIHNLLPRSARQQRRGRWSCSAFLLLARPFLYSGITLLLLLLLFLLSCSCPSGSLGQSFLRNFHSKRPTRNSFSATIWPTNSTDLIDFPGQWVTNRSLWGTNVYVAAAAQGRVSVVQLHRYCLNAHWNSDRFQRYLKWFQIFADASIVFGE